MCETAAYVLKGNQEELLLSDVAKLTFVDGKMELVTILGEKLVLDGSVKEINFIRHKIVIALKG